MRQMAGDEADLIPMSDPQRDGVSDRPARYERRRSGLPDQGAAMVILFR
ncbi:hypothetical protein O4J55_04285 [Paracoccus sp. PXZ]|nr:hypothetical protein [Paracoccus sp. MKU1]